MTKRILLSIILILALTVPVFANERTWEWAIEPIYDIEGIDISTGVIFSEGLALARKDGKWGYIDQEGQTVIPFIFAKAASFSEGLAAASVDGKIMGFIRRYIAQAPLPSTDTSTEASAVPAAAPSSEASAAPASNPSVRKVAYITIDDGPSRNNTTAILDILNEYDATATFFVLSHAGLDDIYKRIVDEGHEIANHSFSHDYQKLYNVDDVEAFETDILKAHNNIIAKSGQTPVTFRFPGGSGGRSEDIMKPRLDILKGLGYRHFNWDVSTGDSDSSPAGKDVDALVNNVISNTKNRSKLVILMHDAADKTATVKALPIIIEKLRGMGYEFDTMKNY